MIKPRELEFRSIPALGCGAHLGVQLLHLRQNQAGLLPLAAEIRICFRPGGD
ncbi:MAG: hypothetical protein H0T39_13770 [Actinobacteria bacterium]|nr:hypothetical protein [Actinomycetota bacterium]